ncbi:MAG: sensor histidine kinase [Verrucomicrobia bacterium]|nr:sensor histidine kinase [Verrucomicrobiota bacterium]
MNFKVGRACPQRAEPDVFQARRAARRERTRPTFDSFMGRVHGPKARELPGNRETRLTSLVPVEAFVNRMLHCTTMVRRVLKLLHGLSLPAVLFGIFFIPGNAAGQQRSVADAPLNVLTQAVQVLKLSPSEASRDYPVRLRAVVTFFEQRTELCFVHDETGGVYVYLKNWARPARAGDVVEVTGTTSAGTFSSSVKQGDLNVIRPGQLPEPKFIAIEQLSAGRDDCRWIQVEGVVRRAVENWGHLLLDLVAGPSRLKVRILEREPGQENLLIDAKVRISGVVSSSHDRLKRLDGFHLMVPGMAQVKTLEPAPADPFSRAQRTSRSLKMKLPGEELDHRVRVRGTVTMHWPGKVLFIQDDTGGVQVRTEQNAPLAPGEVVDVAGYAVLAEGASTVADGIFRSVSQGEPLRPAVATAGEILSGAFDHRLVRLDARVIASADDSPEIQTFSLRAGKESLRAILPKTQGAVPGSRILPNTHVQISGVCARDAGMPALGSFVIWLRSPEDWVLLEQPSGSPSRLLNWRFWLPGMAVLWAFGWVLWLRAGVTRKAEALRLREASLAERQGERELRKALEERERIARDLHDCIIQSIYAVGLNLENCKRLVTEKPAQVEGQLAKVRADLNSVIRDVRNFILGLESEALKGQEFKTALKSIVLTLGEPHALRFGLQIDPLAAEELTSHQATQLLHIAREAVSNSVRHARAERTVLSLQPGEGQIRFEVRDNGMGFDPAAVGPDQRGLRNMATRARELGAAFSVVSQAGQGTRIVLDIPVKNPHESP